MTAYSFDYNGTEYKMEFTRNSVTAAESAFGIDIQNVSSPSISNMENLFHASLIANHPHIKRNTVEMLFDLQDDKVGMFRDLVTMYMETVGTLLSEEDDKKGKAISRKKVQ